MPEPRSSNGARAVFHIGSALVCLSFTLVVFTSAQLPFAAAAFAGTAWTLEILRRQSPAMNDRLMRFFGSIARPAERHRINSGTWYMTALVVLALTGSPSLCVVGVSVLGFADPAAAVVGRRWGRTPLRHGRTLEGSLAFAIVGTVAAVGTIHWLPAPPPAPIAWLAAGAGAIAGALAEIFSKKIDDNLSIPLVSAAAAAAVLEACGASAWA